MEAAINRVKRRVSIEQYQMFDLFVLKQWPARDVAKTLGVTIAHVYVAKHRISKLVRKKIAALEARAVKERNRVANPVKVPPATEMKGRRRRACERSSPAVRPRLLFPVWTVVNDAVNWNFKCWLCLIEFSCATETADIAFAGRVSEVQTGGFCTGRTNGRRTTWGRMC
jgi:hypothetical protein